MWETVLVKILFLPSWEELGPRASWNPEFTEHSSDHPVTENI